jgi:hypothetical protein
VLIASGRFADAPPFWHFSSPCPPELDVSCLGKHAAPPRGPIISRGISAADGTWLDAIDSPAGVDALKNVVVLRTKNGREMSKLVKPLVLFAVFACGTAIGHMVDARAIVQAESDQRVFELRTYTSPPAKLKDLQTRFRSHTAALFQKHGITNIGYWVPQDAPQSQKILVYILAYPNRDEAKKRFAEFEGDPDWKKVLADSAALGPLASKVDSLFLDPLDFSPMK